MTIVKRNGCIHIRDNGRFVKRSFKNVSKVVGRAAFDSNDRPVSVRVILAGLRFNAAGFALVD